PAVPGRLSSHARLSIVGAAQELPVGAPLVGAGRTICGSPPSGTLSLACGWPPRAVLKGRSRSTSSRATPACDPRSATPSLQLITTSRRLDQRDRRFAQRIAQLNE